MIGKIRTSEQDVGKKTTEKQKGKKHPHIRA